MTIADDLSQVFKEIGPQIEIVGTLPVVYEYVDISKTDREGFFTATFSSTSSVIPGNILNVVKTGDKFLVLHVFKQMFENSIVLLDAALVVCRNSLTVKRYVEVKDPVTREKTSSWTTIASTFGYVSQTTTGNTINMENDESFFNEKNKKLYIPESLGVKTGDRAAFGTVNLQIGDIDNLRYPGVSVCELFEDERP